MKIFLTGATGFVGAHLAEFLVERGHEVHALVRETSRHYFLTNLGVHLHYGDLCSLAESKTAWPVFDAVIHLAGQIKGFNYGDFEKINVEGTRCLLDILKRDGAGRFIFVSSISARGPNKTVEDLEGTGPVSHYGKSKLEAEFLVRLYQEHFPVMIVRPPIVYGPGDRESLTLFQMFKKSFFPMVSPELARFSFVHVKDLSAMLAAAAAGQTEKIGPFYPCDDHGAYTFEDLRTIGQDLFGRKVKTLSVPPWIGAIVAGISEKRGVKSGKVPPLTRDKFKEIKKPLWFCSNETMKKTYSFPQTVSLGEGFRETLGWYQREGWI